MSTAIIESKKETEGSNFHHLKINNIKKLKDGKDYIFNHSGSVGVVLKFTPLNHNSLDESGVRNLVETLSRLVSTDDSKDLTICFHFFRTSNVKQIKIDERLPLALKERTDYLNKMFHSGEIFENNFYISVNCHAGGESLSLKEKAEVIYKTARSFISRQTDLDIVRLKSYGLKKRILKISQIAKMIKNTLKPLKMTAEILNGQETINLYRSIIARTSAIPGEDFLIDDSESPRQALMSGVVVKERPEYMIMDDYLHQTYELERISSRVEINHKDILNLMDCPYEVFYTVAITPIEYHESNKVFAKAIERSKVDLEMNTKGNGKAADPALMFEVERLEHSHMEMARVGKGAIKYSVGVTFSHKLPKVMSEMRAKSISIEDYLFEFKEKVRQEIFGRIGQSAWAVADGGQLEVFCEYLPGMCELPLNRLRVLIDIPTNIPFILPIYSQSRHDIKHYGFNHFFSDSMSVVPFSNFDPILPSWAGIISGDMGMGKSVTLNLFLAMAYTSVMVSGVKPLLRILDYGGSKSSYFKLIALLKGTTLKFVGAKRPTIQFLQLNPDQSFPSSWKYKELIQKLKKVGIEHKDDVEMSEKITNYYSMVCFEEDELTEETKDRYTQEVFGRSWVELQEILTLKEGECVPGQDRMNEIMTILEIMISSDPKNPEAFKVDFSRDDVVSIVKALYESITDRSPTMTDLYELVVEYNENAKQPVFAKLASRLSDWTREKGTYKMFDCPTNVDMSNDTILFDLYGLDSDPKLEQIYLILITRLISNDMYMKKGRVKVVTLDEVWKIAKSPEMQEVIIGFYRLSRKYKFQPFLSTQIPTDFHTEISKRFGDVIVSQARNIIICGISDSTVIRNTAALYDLTPEQVEEIKRLGIVDNPSSKLIPRFSRFMQILKHSNGKIVSINRSIISPFEYALVNSSEEDNAICRYYLDVEKMNIEDACQHIARNKHIGDMKLAEYLRKNNMERALEMVLGKK